MQHSAERIGIFGGTFDPPHAGHVTAAMACRRELSLDRVLLVVANEPWQKVPFRPLTPPEDRYELVLSAVQGLPGIEASRIEIDRGGPSYSIDTVHELRAGARAAGQPEPSVYLVVGSDLVESLVTWHRVGELRRLVTLAVVTRPQSPAPVRPAGWVSELVIVPGVDISSSEVRSRVREGRALDALVPDGVVRCIRRRGLYAVPR